MKRARTLAVIALLSLAGCYEDDRPRAVSDPAPVSISADLKKCIARAQAADHAAHYEAGAAWWREAGRVVYGRPCRDDLSRVMADRSQGPPEG